MSGHLLPAEMELELLASTSERLQLRAQGFKSSDIGSLHLVVKTVLEQ